MIDRATHENIREAIDDVLAGGGGSMLEATARMSVEQAQEYATQLVIEKDAGRRVRTWRNGPWLHIEPAKSKAP